MSYKHLNFKCVLLKYHIFSCFDPVFTVEISCFESVKSTQLSHTNQPVGFSGLGSVPALLKTSSDFQLVFFLPADLLPLFKFHVEWFLWLILFSAKMENILISPLMMEKMTDLNKNDFVMSCYLQLSPWMVFWNQKLLTGRGWEEEPEWLWTRPAIFW